MKRLRWTGCDNQAAMRLACECRDGVLNFARITHVDRGQLHSKRWRHCLNCCELADTCRGRRVAKDRHSRHTWGDLFEQFQPFPANAVFIQQETSSIAARVR